MSSPDNPTESNPTDQPRDRSRAIAAAEEIMALRFDGQPSREVLAAIIYRLVEEPMREEMRDERKAGIDEERRYNAAHVNAMQETCTALRAKVGDLQHRDSEAAQYVESVIAMRTDFSGEEPYVGWKGLGLSLTEALDERDSLRAKLEAAEADIERLEDDVEHGIKINNELQAKVEQYRKIENKRNRCACTWGEDEEGFDTEDPIELCNYHEPLLSGLRAKVGKLEAKCETQSRDITVGHRIIEDRQERGTEALIRAERAEAKLAAAEKSIDRIRANWPHIQVRDMSTQWGTKDPGAPTCLRCKIEALAAYDAEREGR